MGDAIVNKAAEVLHAHRLVFIGEPPTPHCNCGLGIPDDGDYAIHRTHVALKLRDAGLLVRPIPTPKPRLYQVPDWVTDEDLAQARAINARIGQLLNESLRDFESTLTPTADADGGTSGPVRATDGLGALEGRTGPADGEEGAVSEILDTIDGALGDYQTSPDAMRWTPEPKVEEPKLDMSAYVSGGNFRGVSPVTFYTDCVWPQIRMERVFSDANSVTFRATIDAAYLMTATDVARIFGLPMRMLSLGMRHHPEPPTHSAERTRRPRNRAGTRRTKKHARRQR